MAWVPSYGWIVRHPTETIEAGDATLNTGILKPYALLTARNPDCWDFAHFEIQQNEGFGEADPLKAGFWRVERAAGKYKNANARPNSADHEGI